MNEEFDVPVNSATVVRPHVVVENMSAEMASDEQTPVLFDTNVHHFHDVGGGYIREDDEYAVTLIHRVQGDGSPPNSPKPQTVEVHTPDSYYMFEITDVSEWDMDYPDEEYVLTLYADEYVSGKHTFHDELLLDIDKREQEFSYDE